MKKPFRAFIYLISILLFALVISVNFLKPFGFFRDSNPVMVCINAKMWQQYPELKRKNIPIQSYAYDPQADPATQLQSSVPSFGDGWFVLPYYYFTIFSIPISEVSIRIFSLLWLAITLLTLYMLSRQLTSEASRWPGRVAGETSIIFPALLFYVFNAAVLWYNVNGYVHEIAVLPFYFLSWWLLGRYLLTPSNPILIALFITLFIGVQFDWLPFFQAACMSVYLFMERKKTRQRAAFIIPLLAVILGAAYVFYSYIQWVGLPVYADHLKEKFMSRTVGGGGLEILPWLNFNFNILLFYIISYGLLFGLFLYGLFKRTVKNPLIWLMIITAIAHHLVFWGFTTEHDYGVIKMAFPVSFIAAGVLSTISATRRTIVNIAVLSTNIFIYFFLHNLHKRGGMYSDPEFCFKTGTFIHTNLPSKKDHVFLDTEGKYLLPIEYYAQKPYVEAESLEEAQELFHEEDPGENGYFLAIKNGEIVKVTKLK
jgi:hypothetical protein